NRPVVVDVVLRDRLAPRKAGMRRWISAGWRAPAAACAWPANDPSRSRLWNRARVDEGQEQPAFFGLRLLQVEANQRMSVILARNEIQKLNRLDHSQRDLGPRRASGSVREQQCVAVVFVRLYHSPQGRRRANIVLFEPLEKLPWREGLRSVHKLPL